jgi:MoxR-like ATPase
VKHIARPVLRHRLILTAELEMEGHSVDALLDEWLERVEAPRT